MFKKYMFSIYFCSAIIMLCFSISSEKQFITNTSVVFGFDDFIQILLKNTVAGIWLLSAYILGDLIIYIFFITNGIVLGALLSTFPNIIYLLLVIPHGVIEIFSYIYLSDTIINKRKGCYDIQDFVKRLKISFLLLMLGAGIEAFITPLMINFIE
ncbi:TPA: stage II sporulation protein M [Streptococcus suis]|nr:stage II sporulation protein M [Streptococcus suis]